ncbi:SET domain-containing protein-lysine N-methyltransferase [Salmonella enterica]|nr:SET domain-containing protein-lysine N-methyltransferase [Salmonella enterica]EAW1959956.1 SET domain-containing protein-lysine N-methyltransferase [Salmonella enterica subsp. enterica]EBH3853023.1 SET domain-containing protein [Salmonella enterica subsp. diarizonae]EBH8064115.1 SET domain-containing protein [Salmonella bongori]EBH9879144.1 SET domain-containing protein-lysine N-methyltransferase [Salmonella enterica subsp. enterica serovar 6,7:-1,5]EBT7756292.1 SET domain-containing protei
MRGIGAVTHLSSPTGSSAPCPDFSGMWNSIRDWFSLPVQDEAALCFHVFYQPDEGTSLPDRLKHFLRLKALASPGRQDNFTAERILGTGETICMIASGKSSDLPSVTLHLSDQEWHTAQPQEAVAPLAEATESPGRGPTGPPITRTQIQTWLDLPQEAKSDAGGWRKWAQAQGVTLGSAALYLTNTGLTPYGRERLHPPKERGRPITVGQIQTWRDLSEEARSAAGGWVTWAQAQGISITSARKHLTNMGLTFYGMERLQHPKERGAPITKAQLLTWFNMSQEEHNKAGGWITWAQTQGIATSSARSCLTNTGLTTRGMERLQLPEKRGLPITDRQIQAWKDLPQEKKHEAGGRIKWAQTQGIAIRSAENFLTNTGLTLFGIERLLPPEKRGTPITNAQILAWQELSQEAKNEAGGCIKWAQAQGITISSACSYLTNTGLTHHGRKRLQPPEERGSTISQAQLLEWFNMSQEERTKTGGWRRWAEARGITFRSAETFLTNSGLTLFGIERLKPPGERGAPITNAQIRTWRDMSQEAKREAGGWIKWALAQGIAIGSASGYLTNTGLKYNGILRLQQSLSATVTSDSQQTSMSAGASDEITASVGILPERSGEKRSLPSTKEDISAPPAKQIKKEEDAVTWRTHQINNNLPILQHWRDPTISVMAQAEGKIETLQVTRWGPLFNPLPRQIKARINQDIRWFLQNEGSHDARMNAMMSVAIPLDDSDGYRGRTVYARTDLAAFTVLGPYSGRLLDSEKVRCEYEKEYGKEAGNYYFATRSQERIVSGFPQGNLLSLLNSPVFTHRTAEAEVRQNVSAVLVGKNINFFLTTRDVHAGDELWFDYGPDYQHFEPGETLRPTQVKEEPPSSEGE